MSFVPRLHCNFLIYLSWKPLYSLARLIFISSSSEASKAVCREWADTCGNSSWAKGRFTPGLSPSQTHPLRASKLSGQPNSHVSRFWFTHEVKWIHDTKNTSLTLLHFSWYERGHCLTDGPVLAASPPGASPLSALDAATRPPCCRHEWAMSGGEPGPAPQTPGWRAALSFSGTAYWNLSRKV